MHSFQLHAPDEVLSPSLLFGWAGIQANLERMLAIAGSPTRLRPHMKTHKTREITQLYMDAGITKHKCATLREAEVLAECGVRDVFIAYPMIGPNQHRLVELAQRYRYTRFSSTGDDLPSLRSLNNLAAHNGLELGIFLDFNVGLNRTGMYHDPASLNEMQNFRYLRFSGLHLYDSLSKTNPEEMLSHIKQTYERACELRTRFTRHGPQTMEIVLGGTPAFLLQATHINDQDITLSPGTAILHDAGYGSLFPDLGFTPAAAVLTRCISRPGPKLVTFDIGTKAICADPPFGKRVHLVELPDAVCTLHNEEHYVVETDEAEQWHPGRVTYAIPKHICPTVAMYDKAQVVEDGRIARDITIAARGR
jgi:D-threonine aldolase